jgi:segregation and condensation protein A
MASDQISIKERMNELIAVMEEKGSITFTELFDDASEKSYIIVTFLAVLELMKLSLTHVVQHAQSGIIRIFYQ